MPLAVVGISHKTAPVDLRETMSVPKEGLGEILASARKDVGLTEAVLLSTCNRTELYAAAEPQALDALADFLCRRFNKPELKNHLYRKTDGDAIRHLFNVAAGLDSLVLGEHEILKQVKDAYLCAHQSGATGKRLNVLFQRALFVGKQVRTHTGLGHGNVSVGGVAVSLAETIFGDLSDSSVLVFGAGKMAEVSARYLLSKKVKRLMVANRTVENARALAEKFHGEALSLEQGMDRMVTADIVIASMAAPEPVLKKDFIASLMPRRQNRSLFLVDIAVPRNVESGAHALDNVYLYNIDDLQAIVTENAAGRGQESRKAELIVEQKSAEFLEWARALDSGAEKSLKHDSGLTSEPLS